MATTTAEPEGVLPVDKPAGPTSRAMARMYVPLDTNTSISTSLPS